jgi:hypothetical protein
MHKTGAFSRNPRILAEKNLLAQPHGIWLVKKKRSSGFIHKLLQVKAMAVMIFYLF